jgi:transcriptional regulator with XRE-family HTH domain
MEHKIHEGRNVKRFREMLGLKQEALAAELGDEWTQKQVSLLEAKDSVESGLLKRIAEVMKIPIEAFKNFDEEQAINIISNTITNYDNASVVNIYPTFHPIDEIKKLHEEKIHLYERMLKEKEEMILRLEKILQAGS